MCEWVGGWAIKSRVDRWDEKKDILALGLGCLWKQIRFFLWNEIGLLVLWNPITLGDLEGCLDDGRIFFSTNGRNTLSELSTIKLNSGC